MKKLKWDSKFWGILVYQLENFDNIKSKDFVNDNYLIQALVNVEDVININKLENNGFHFKESKITLTKKKFSQTILKNYEIRELSLTSLRENKELINNLFLNNTRFDIFSEKKINEFYYIWLENSVKGEMDDKCIGFFLNDNLAGFVTYRIESKNISIGLLGVLKKFQGTGISQLILNYIDNIAIQESLTSIRISTQGKNLRALNAYIKNDFRISSIDHWYYYQKEIKND